MGTRTRLLAAAALATALLVSCRAIASLRGLFDPGDLVQEPRVVGTWRADTAPGADRWVVARLDSTDRTYDLAITDPRSAAALLRIDVPLLVTQDSAMLARLRRDPALRARRERDSVTVTRLYSDSGGPRLFTVGLGRLGGELFADITPNPVAAQRTHLGRDLMEPMHWFWRVSFAGERLVLTPLDEDWLGTQLDSGRVSLAHEDLGDARAVLTAGTADLQRFVAAHALDTLAFPAKGALTLRR